MFCINLLIILIIALHTFVSKAKYPTTISLDTPVCYSNLDIIVKHVSNECAASEARDKLCPTILQMPIQLAYYVILSPAYIIGFYPSFGRCKWFIKSSFSFSNALFLIFNSLFSFCFCNNSLSTPSNKQVRLSFHVEPGPNYGLCQIRPSRQSMAK